MIIFSLVSNNLFKLDVICIQDLLDYSSTLNYSISPFNYEAYNKKNKLVNEEEVGNFTFLYRKNKSKKIS